MPTNLLVIQFICKKSCRTRPSSLQQAIFSLQLVTGCPRRQGSPGPGLLIYLLHLSLSCLVLWLRPINKQFKSMQ